MTTYTANIRGTTKFYDKEALIVQVPDISEYVMVIPTVNGVNIDRAFFPTNFVEKCIKREDFKANCDGNCNCDKFDAEIDLIRGQLLDPPKSGKNAGIPRNPNYPNNYKYEFNGFIASKIATPKPPSIAESISALAPTNRLTDGEIQTLRRELATNDRTALMQSTSYFVAEPIEDVLLGATKMADWLNKRTVIRHTGSDWLYPTTKQSKDNPNTVIKNRDDMNKEITARAYTAEQCKQALASIGMDSSDDFLAEHPNDYQALFNLISSYIEGSEGTDLW